MSKGVLDMAMSVDGIASALAASLSVNILQTSLAWYTRRTRLHRRLGQDDGARGLERIKEAGSVLETEPVDTP